MAPRKRFFCGFVIPVMLALPSAADSLVGLAEVEVVDDAMVSLHHEGVDYVVADGHLDLGVTTRWYVPADTGVAMLWEEGEPAPAATVSGTSNPKQGDVGSEADNFLFALQGAASLSSLDGIDYQETVFTSPRDTFFLFERGGNDAGIWQAIRVDGTLGPEVAFDKTSNGGPYADTGVSVDGQNAYGVVFKTDEPVLGLRIVASGHDTLSISTPTPRTLQVRKVTELEAAAATARAGDIIVLAKGRYNLRAQIPIRSGVTYRGTGGGLTVIDGNHRTRAFVAWGDRTHNNTSENPNDSGPKAWVLEGLTFESCMADGNDIFDYAGVAHALQYDFSEFDWNGDWVLDLDEAADGVPAIRLPGPDGIVPSGDDDIHRFEAMDGDGDGKLSEAELDEQMARPEVEFPDESQHGGALFVDNGAEGTVRDCLFIENHTRPEGGDGGAIAIAGLSVLTIEGCQFDGNYAVSRDGVFKDRLDGDGGHIAVQTDSPSAVTAGSTLIANHCDFLNGRVEDDGGAIHAGAVGTVVRLDACWFEGNTAADDGTVLCVDHPLCHELTVTNCAFAYNKATFDSDMLCQVKRNARFVNCSFVANSQGDQAIIENTAEIADTDNDSVNDEFTDATLVINCLFSSNIVGDGDQVLRANSDAFTVAPTNCLFSGNRRWNTQDAPNVRKLYITEVGSVEADPRLDNTLLPRPGSPAIDSGVDPIAWGIELLTDFSGNARPQGSAYDIGVDEQ